MSHLAFTILFGALMFPAVFMVFIPIMPAMLYVFLMSALYGFLDGFVNLRPWELGILAGIFCLSAVVDYSAGILGAKYAGASKSSILCGFIGLIVGVLVLPPFGGIPGLFFGIFLNELLSANGIAAAFKAAAGSLTGAIIGVALNFILIMLFLALFVIFASS